MAATSTAMIDPFQLPHLENGGSIKNPSKKRDRQRAWNRLVRGQSVSSPLAVLESASRDILHSLRSEGSAADEADAGESGYFYPSADVCIESNRNKPSLLRNEEQSQQGQHAVDEEEEEDQGEEVIVCLQTDINYDPDQYQYQHQHQQRSISFQPPPPFLQASQNQTNQRCNFGDGGSSGGRSNRSPKTPKPKKATIKPVDTVYTNNSPATPTSLLSNVGIHSALLGNTESSVVKIPINRTTSPRSSAFAASGSTSATGTSGVSAILSRGQSGKAKVTSTSLLTRRTESSLTPKLKPKHKHSGFLNLQPDSNHSYSGRHHHPRISPQSNSTTTTTTRFSNMLQNPKPRIEIPRHRQSSIYGDDVSPPDSPRTADGRRLSSSPNISPITDAGSAHRFSAARTSNVPLPRQASHGGTASFISGWREKIAAAQAAGQGKTRWDDYSGDPTTSEAGKDATVVPGSFHHLGSKTVVSSIPQPKPSLFGVSLKKNARREPATTIAREEWKGASGHLPILPTVEQKLNPQKQFFPSPMQRRQKGGFRQAMGFKPQERSASPRSLAIMSAAQINTHQTNIPDESDVETPTVGTPIEDRVIPLRGDSMAHIPSTPPSRGAALADSNRPEDRPLPAIPQISVAEPAPVPRVREPIHRKPVTPRAHSPELDVDVEPMPPHDFNPGIVSEAFARLGITNEPTSRFSATTYNTTVPEDSADQSFDEPELPEMPMPEESVLNRRRPIQTSGYLPRNQPTRKPTPSEREIKSMPAIPADEIPVDRVTHLEAVLAGLERRRTNIQTVIHELTNVVQPSSIAYDNASRQEIKKAVESMQIEVAAVSKEIHDTGLKLHRAMKKRDDASSYEPTGLWVRRVTE